MLFSLMINSLKKGGLVLFTQGFQRSHLNVGKIQSSVEEAARDALIHFNLMIRQGHKPSAVVYTNLIHTMGKAKWEWQAYKLFSRMLEEGVLPLPETYVALRNATSSNRRKLINDINSKIQSYTKEFPELLLKRQEKSHMSIERTLEAEENMFNQLKDGSLVDVLDKLYGNSHLPIEPDTKLSKISKYSSMHIGHPTEVWEIQKTMNAQDAKSESNGLTRYASNLKQEDKAALLDKMRILHIEEMKILLAIKRQLPLPENSNWENYAKAVISCLDPNRILSIC